MGNTATETFKKIEEKAVISKPFTRHISEMNIGNVIRQGDIYVEKVDDNHHHASDKAMRQLAIGNTQGSRHIADGDVEIFSPSEKSPLVGPVVKAQSRWILTHPEHGHFSLPAGCYQVRYQRDYASERAEEIRRVQD